mgnify:CR=1 FL=1
MTRARKFKQFFLSVVFVAFTASVSFAQENGESPALNTAPGIMMQDTGSLWVQNQNGVMIWAANVKRGEALDIYLSEQVDAYGNLLEEKKTAWRVSNGESAKNDFVHVRYNNSDYWAISNRVAKAFKTGKISTACAVYRSLDLSDVRLTSLAAGTLVCIGQEIPVTSKINLTEVTFFDSANFTTVTAYVLSEKVTEDK